MPAAGASPGLATLRGGVLAEHTLLLALRAVRMFTIGRIARAPQVLQARGVVGEVAHELHERKRGLRGRRSEGIVSVRCGHAVNILDTSGGVKRLDIKI